MRLAQATGFLTIESKRPPLPADLAGRCADSAARRGGTGGKTRRLGVLHVGSERTDLSWAFFKELRDQGWVEGRNLIVTERFLGWDVVVRSDARVAAKELLEGKVDVLATFGFTAADILKQSTREVPIVFGYVNDPVATALVDSIARPGENITGVTRQGVDVIEKRLDLLKATVPGLRRVFQQRSAR